MKKTLRLLIILLAVSLMAITISGCVTDKDTHKGSVSFDINTASDFIDIANKLGRDYDLAKFELKQDIDFNENWYPIGDSIDNSFRGRLKGNGHTITLTKDSSAELENNHLALFGYIYNATIEDLNIDITYDVVSKVDEAYVGGVAGYAYGNNTFKNVTVNGEISVVPEHKQKYIADTDSYIPLIDRKIFVGGLFGYGTGKFDIDNVDINLDIDIMPNAEHHDYTYGDFIFSSVYAGNIAGYLRTIDLSSDNKVRHTIKNITACPDYNIDAENTYVGGLIGVAYNTDITNLAVGNKNSNCTIETQALVHAYTGGAFGLIDACNLTNADLMVDIIVEPNISSGTIAYNIGGAVGFADNNSMLSNISVQDIKIFAMIPVSNISAETYGGGIVGVLRNSKLTNSVSTGGFVVHNKSSAEGLLEIASGGIQLVVTCYAGAVGMVYGQAELNNIEVDFIAYQGIVSKVSSSIKIEKIVDEDGKEQNIVELDKTPILTDCIFTADKSGAYYYNSNDKNLQTNGYGEPILPADDPSDDSEDNE